MSLRLKFILVLLAFCLAVVINIATALWVNAIQVREARETYSSTFKALTLREEAQRELEAQRVALEPAWRNPPAPERTAEVESACQAMGIFTGRLGRALEELALSSQYRVDLDRTVTDYRQDLEDFLQRSGELTPAYRAEARRNYLAHHQAVMDLLKEIKTVLNKFERQASREMSSSAIPGLLVVMASVEIVILMVVFGFFRTWMLIPITNVQQATQEIARGNLAYRLQPASNDELGALALQVNHMAASLDKAQKELKQTERMAAVGEMVSVVAHNIRNPLAGIRATAQTAMHECPPESQLLGQLKRIINAVDSLEQWLKGLLHLNRPLDLNLQSTPIDDIISELQHVFQPSIQRKNLKLHYAPCASSQMIHVDRRHFEQALASILDNAIEASPAGSTVHIETGYKGPGGERFYIDISDAGLGVAPRHRSRIFDAHFSTKPGGTGIGLSMARKIIEAHSGRVSILDTTGGPVRVGSTFRIDIPGRNGGSSRWPTS